MSTQTEAEHLNHFEINPVSPLVIESQVFRGPEKKDNAKSVSLFFDILKNPTLFREHFSKCQNTRKDVINDIVPLSKGAQSQYNFRMSTVTYDWSKSKT